MKTSRTIGSIALSVALVAGVGCSMGATDEASATDESSIRAMTPEEIVGEIAYGDTKEVDNVTPTPTYRALSFKGEKGDIIEARAASLDATDPVLWLTDDAFTTLSVNNDTSTTDNGATIRNRTLPKTGTYFLVFREMNRAPRAKFAVSLKKTGAIPAACDPDGEGIVDPNCTDPLEFDPFDPNSCSGPALSAADAATKFPAAGLALTESKIYYRARQCTVAQEGATPECSPWVRSFLMDVVLARVNASATPNTFVFGATPSPTATTGRTKVKIEFGTEPASLTAFCVDGPFTALRNVGPWAKFEDGTAGVCGKETVSAPVVTATCARFEPPTIQLSSDDPTRYTEYSAVLFARYP